MGSNEKAPPNAGGVPARRLNSPLGCPFGKRTLVEGTILFLSDLIKVNP